MRSPFRPFHLLFCLLLLGCGSSTRIVQSWRDPEVSVQQGSVKKILVIAMVRDEATRRIAEDELSAQFQGRGISSYGYLGPLPQQIETGPFVERLRNDGFDAMMIMRLVDVTKEQTYVPGSYPTYYASPYGYYGHAYPLYSDPGYVRTDMSYRVETNFYSVAREKLVWSGVTTSLNPDDISLTLAEIMRAIKEKMVHEGFLTPAPAP